MASSSKLRNYLPILLAVFLVIGMLLGAILTRNRSFMPSLGKSYDPLMEIMRYVQNDYVDSVDMFSLQKSAISGMLSGLDPHSQYISAEEFNEVNDPLMGNFDGIGVQFRMGNDTVYIISPLPGGPSEKVGILAGDRIVKVDGENVAGVKMETNEVMRRLKGPRGTKVTVSILRRGLKNLLDLDIIRDVIPTYSVDVAYMVEPEIGYLKLSRFSATTVEEVKENLKMLKDQGMKKLIFDLRGNSGGYLEAAIYVADEFLPDKKLVVYTEGYNRPREYAYATRKGIGEDVSLVMLIDEGSASSSEILAGAIQDNDRGLLIGRRTFGKGLVQEQLSLPDGSAIRLTVARYYTPSGRSIQKPYERGHNMEYEMEIMDRFSSGELENPDSIKQVDSLKFQTTRGRTVYGGGGIMPDVYMPVKRVERNDFYKAVTNTGLVYQYSFDYTDRNRKALNKYPSATEFERSFVISEGMFSDFVKYAQTKGVTPNVGQIAEARKDLSDMIKSFIARNIYDDKGFYPIFLKSDDTFLRAIEAIKNNEEGLL